MTNDELLAAWKSKLPAVEATDRDLSAFALGVEVGMGAMAPQNATEAMQKRKQIAVMLRKSMNEVWRAALAEAGLLRA